MTGIAVVCIVGALISCSRGAKLVEYQAMPRVVASTVALEISAGDHVVTTSDLEAMEKIARDALQDRRVVVAPAPGDLTIRIELSIGARGSRLGGGDHANVSARIWVTRRDQATPIATIDIQATSKHAGRENFDSEVELAFATLADRLAKYIAAHIDRPANG